MNTQTRITPIATRVALHPFLAGMNRTQLSLLTDCAMVVQFKRTSDFREGEIANRFYLIETGRVILESSGALGDPVVIDTIGAGDLLGWSWMCFPPYVAFHRRAVELADSHFFYGTILHERYCERDHSLRLQLFKRIGAMLDQASAKPRAKKWWRSTRMKPNCSPSCSNLRLWTRNWTLRLLAVAQNALTRLDARVRT